MILFVYGTLKRGYWNHQNFIGGSEFLGEGQTEREFAMAGSGVPYLVPSETWAAPILGEVFIFDGSGGRLERLDRLEGAYRRRRGMIRMEDGKRLSAYYYVSRWGADDHAKRQGYHRHLADCGGLQWPARDSGVERMRA